MFYQDYVIKKVITITLLFLTLAGCEEEVEPVTSSPVIIQSHNCPLKQQAGKNVHETHEVDLFITPPGTFNFSYDTFTARDRIIVTYERIVLLDTGCVGEKIEKNLLILPENPNVDKGKRASSKIIVSVEPNCQGNENDTEWFFTVDCPRCDFGSSDNDPQRCFGGVGARCKNDTLGLATKTYDHVNCTVEGFMSVGSILHDNCCIHNPKGYSCQGLNSNNSGLPEKLAPCKEEWEEAWGNTSCGRQWKVKFGSYFEGNKGDFLDENYVFFVGKQSLKVPKGQKIDPKYQHLCNGGQCVTSTTSQTNIGFDSCGLYCLCD